MNDGGEIVGMVDVLKLTYATLEQINTMSTGDNEGPAWNKFWLSLDHETESIMSGDGSQQHTNLGSRLMSPDLTRERLGDSVAPGDSASHAGVSPPHSEFIPGGGAGSSAQSPAELPFPFKFKAPSGRVHRLQVIASQGVGAMVANVVAKLGAEADAIGGTPTAEDGKISGGFALSYLDDEGDTVSITTDNDLLEAILLARQGRRDKVDLFVHDPEKPPEAPAPLPAADPTPASTTSGLRERRRAMDDEEEEDGDDEDDYRSSSALLRRSRHARTQSPEQEQVIAGVPNELLLPGAIVTLAVVIVGVFTISRLTSR